MATLEDVIDRIKTEGQLTRNSGTNSLKVIASELKSMNNNQIKFFDFMRDYIIQQGQLGALAPPPPTPPPAATPAAPQTPAPAQPAGKFSLTGAVLALGLGLAAAVSSFFDEIVNAIRAPAALKIITAFGTRLANTFSILQRPLNFLRNSVTFVTGIFTRIGNFFNSAFGKQGTIGKTIGKVTAYLKKVIDFSDPIIKFFRTILSSTSSIFSPLRAIFSSIGSALKFLRVAMGPVGVVIFSLIDFVKGFMKGFGEEGLLGGIKEGLLEVIRGLITKPLDLLKDLVSWAAGKLGFSEFESMLDSFSFTDMFNKFVVALEEVFEDVGKWFGTLFSDPVTAIEQAVDTSLEIFRDFGKFVYDNALKPVGDFLSDLFSDEIEAFKTNFAAIGNWFSGIADRIMFAAEEIWINAVADLKKNFLSLFNYLASLPDKVLIGAQQLVIDTLGDTYLGRKALSSLGITQESVDSQRADLASSQGADSAVMQRLDAERAAKLADLETRKQAASLATMAEGGVGAGKSSGANIVAPTTVGPTYTGTVYNGPVTVNNDSSSTFGLNPNDKTQMAYGF